MNSLWLVSLLPLIVSPSAREVQDAYPATTPRKIAIVVFPGVELLDFAGPGEVFSSTRGPDGRAFEVFTVATTTEPIVSQGFVTITPGFDLASCPKPDIVVVPGGAAPTRDLELRKWILACAEECELVMSVCNGASVLAAAGLLQNLEITTHHSALVRVQLLEPTARVVANRRFVDSGRILTAAGVSAGIDGALYVVARLLDDETARKTARYMEYDWRPERIAQLHAEPPELIVESPSFELLAILRTEGMDATLSTYWSWREVGRAAPDEAQLNRFGYALLGSVREAEAVHVFELTAAIFPASPNAQDSLAEAYEQQGRLEPALAASERALELLEQGAEVSVTNAKLIRASSAARVARVRAAR